jgi:integrase
MSNRRTLSDRAVAALRPMAQRYAMPDPELRGHYVRVTPSGAKSFVTVARSPEGKQVWTTLGACDVMSIAEARERARATIKRVRAGMPALEAKTETFGDVAQNWIKRHVEPNGLRSRKQIEQLLANHVLPLWRDREFISIRRSDVATLLDDIEDGHSPRQADAVLTVVRSMMNWFATRHDDYTPPIVRGMRRQSPKAQARARILSDDEISAIWHAAETSDTFGAILKMCLLTGQRRSKVAGMRWADLSIDGKWKIPKDPREKDSAGTLLLPDMAVAVIREQPRLGDNPHVFAGRGPRAFQGWSKCKARLDAKLPPGLPQWVVHDLRRTARSLLSRCGVRPDIGEHVLGHAVQGVEGIYDRHSYDAEKADALRRLAGLIQQIVGPPQDNVVAMKRGKRR